MSQVNEKHRPAMGRQIIEVFKSAPAGIIIDATLGDGGHAELLLNRLDFVLYGIDCDPRAIETSKKRLSGYGDRVIIIHGRFGDLRAIIRDEAIPSPSGILFDLGLRSAHIDQPERGFSFSKEARLDMRMDPSQKLSAYTIVNRYEEKDIRNIISSFGEQKEATRIAGAIVKQRAKKPIETTQELANIVRAVVPICRNSDLARVFQAFRIAVNDEICQLKNGLEAALDNLLPDGMLVVISYHSLEDREVKRFMVREEKGCICPPDIPICRCGHSPRLRRLNKRPFTPDQAEIENNPRARSAKMRVAVKL